MDDLADDERIEGYLLSLDEAALRALVFEASLRDDALREKLLMAAAVAESKDLKSLRNVVEQATRTHGFVEWREAGNYANRLDDLAVLLEERIAEGVPELVLLIEEAVSLAEAALQHIDDSGGEVMPAILHLQKVHLAACIALRPDPVALGKRLHDYQIDGEWDTYSEVLPAYSAALGEAGLKVYRRRVEDAWKALPQLNPEDYRNSWSSERVRVEAAMEAIATHIGDFELLLAVGMKNLSSPVRFLELARLFQARDRIDEALAWVERGVAAFPNERLDDLLSRGIELQLARGTHAEAEALAWHRFEMDAGCEAYFRLLEVADQIDRRPELRDKALAYLWERVAEDESPIGMARRSRWEQPRRGEIVSIFLREGNADSMWEAFCGGSVAIELWDRVAAERGKSHHEEAIALYKRLLPHVVEGGARGSHYGEAFAIVKKIQALRTAHKQLGIFGDELAGIRLEWKRKRNFQKLLDTL